MSVAWVGTSNVTICEEMPIIRKKRRNLTRIERSQRARNAAPLIFAATVIFWLCMYQLALYVQPAAFVPAGLIK